jgi:hypothetical protein
VAAVASVAKAKHARTMLNTSRKHLFMMSPHTIRDAPKMERVSAGDGADTVRRQHLGLHAGCQIASNDYAQEPKVCAAKCQPDRGLQSRDKNSLANPGQASLPKNPACAQTWTPQAPAVMRRVTCKRSLRGLGNPPGGVSVLLSSEFSDGQMLPFFPKTIAVIPVTIWRDKF